MLVLQINGIKNFMSKLFLKDTFDRFYLVEAVIVTANTFTIDGKIKKEYYSAEENKERQNIEYSLWEAIRPLCFQLIKGKKTPLSMKLIFRLTPEQSKQLLQKSGLSFQEDEIGGYYFNLRYENSTAVLTTGISMKTFTMDKSLENYWDQTMRDFLKKSEIDTE